ncbi:uncharacterized protein LOC128546005 [Mercenaria mercenaria]|uniref:uncharacterized protein LOC128546005 n=1 Tax=Mercenaria mercenaria TaxID=6596 RepID=UPI00234F9F06|nr:uncharacterized protein LOC128546005 [Mercenaria mercenaria]XP_053403335.1 uncharacterized protein LOC128546005 [Mercenaria mercenaria]
MDRLADELRDFSLRLSHVLDDIGVNERTVMMRRSTGLLTESLYTQEHFVNKNGRSTYFHFGSQTEGTTTLGLKSDTDTLVCDNRCNIIQDWGQWEQGKENLLMLRDNVAPGYCRLQLLRSDIPVAWEDLPGDHFEYDDEGRVLMKNTTLNSGLLPGLIRHGPSSSDENINADYVPGLPSKNWPTEALPWVTRTTADQWPGRKTKCFAVNSGCFVVPTGHCLSETERLEWRISTSIAERCLMFNMNITQIRCYVVLKMIMKTFLNGIVTSYQCKTVLMHLVEITNSQLWREENLISCIIMSLRLLQLCVFINNCPHYFIPENNLLDGRLNLETRQNIVFMIGNIIDSKCIAILGIEMDNIGDRLYAICNPFIRRNSIYFMSPKDVCLNVYNRLQYDLYREIHTSFQDIVNGLDNHTHIMNCNDMKDRIRNVLKFRANGSCSERAAAEVLAPLLCTTLGTKLASADISRGRCISAESLQWLSLGIDSDVASGRLKLASALFCSGSIGKASMILNDVEQKYDTRVTEPMCRCMSTGVLGNMSSLRLSENCFLCYNYKTTLNINVAFGVVFTRQEIHCVPNALKYEMFRCPEEERRTRDEDMDFWMDWAVVDSLPYLYYLQYMTYRRLDNRAGQQRVLGRLIHTINTEPRLHHRETALNLLGQCMEIEDRLMDAFTCYRRSLNLKSTNNVARWHIVKLLYRFFVKE